MVDYLYQEEASLELGLEDWDSEDEIPLASFLPEGKIHWTSNPNYALTTAPFAEQFRPTLPDNLERPVDFFLHLLSEDLLNKIVLLYLPEHGTKVRCAHCSTKAEAHRTRWHCISCKVGLCISEKRNCFIPFHTE